VAGAYMVFWNNLGLEKAGPPALPLAPSVWFGGALDIGLERVMNCVVPCHTLGPLPSSFWVSKRLCFWFGSWV
jgi:hypothetical protein